MYIIIVLVYTQTHVCICPVRLSGIFSGQIFCWDSGLLGLNFHYKYLGNYLSLKPQTLCADSLYKPT